MRKLFFSFFLLFVAFAAVVTPVFAQQQQQNVMLNKDQTITGDYFASGNTVTVLGTVDGDAYVTGGTVTMDGTVKNDIIAGGGTVTISGTAQNIRVAGGTVTINGNVAKNVTVFGGDVTIEPNAKIGGSLVAAGGTVTILSPIGKAATLGGGQVSINNSINGGVTAGVKQLTLQPQAKINGDLNYTSNQKVQIAKGATVTGEIKQTMPNQNRQGMKQKVLAGLGIAWFTFGFANFICMLLIGLLLIFFAPNYFKRVADSIIEKPWWCLGVGILTVIFTPVILVIIFATIIGIPLALLLLLIYLVALYLAKLFVMYLIGERIGRKMNPKLHMAWFFVIGLVIYQFLVLIPLIGWLIDTLAMFFGLGALLIQKKYLYLTLRKNKTI